MNINQAIDIIKTKSTGFEVSTQSERELKSAIENVKRRTNNFTTTAFLSDRKLDIKNYLIESKIDPEKWLEMKKDKYQHSEIDTVLWLADELNNYKSDNKAKELSDLLKTEIQLLK